METKEFLAVTTIISWDTRHWVSEFNKSLAHEDKPLIEEKTEVFQNMTTICSLS